MYCTVPQQRMYALTKKKSALLSRHVPIAFITYATAISWKIGLQSETTRFVDPLGFVLSLARQLLAGLYCVLSSLVRFRNFTVPPCTSSTFLCYVWD